MKKEDDDEERSEGFVRIYEFFTRYVRRIHPDTHWKRAMKMNPKYGLVPTDYSKRHCFRHFFDEEWNASVEEEDGSVRE